VIPAGFTEVARRELEDGQVLVACADSRTAIHIEHPAGPFTRRDAGRILEALHDGFDALPRMFSTEEQTRRRTA
jgi:hypothetical protein